VVSELKVSVLDQEDMWRTKYEVGIAHRQEINGDNEDVAEATISLAIRSAMAERDRGRGRRRPERSKG
jgi:hypothetical protein